MSKILVFIPTYNERENVEPMCEQLLALDIDADILFLDDNSPDGTGQILDSLALRSPRVQVIHRSGKLGIGGAHQDGIAYAYDHGYETLVTLDCDFTHSPTDIPRLLGEAQAADLVVGSRYLTEDSLPGWTMTRRALTRMGHKLTERLLHIPGDATGAFRVYQLGRIPREMFRLVQSRGYAFFFESLFVAGANRLKIVDVPIVLPARTYGHSKMSLKEVRRSVEQLATLYLANLSNSAQFRLGAPISVNPELHDPQGWDAYWEKKQRRTALAYDLAASAYRQLFIESRLVATIRREFPPGAHLLHAGCGSGQVDHGVHENARVTAVDISIPALETYRKFNPDAFELRHATIFDLPFPEGTFDGIYNLGVVEHFTSDELERVLVEFRRVLKPGGKLVFFWPHAHATSVAVLNAIHFALNDIAGKNVRLHPPEVSLVRSKEQAAELLAKQGFEVLSYEFGPRDLFVQAVVVARRT